MANHSGYVLLRRGVTTVATGAGDQAKPGSSATITLWESDPAATSNTRLGLQHKRVVVNLYSSHASATDGLSFEESNDNTNWRVLVTYTLAATTYSKYYVAMCAPFTRVRYTNSANTLTTWESAVLGDANERGNV